MNRASTQPDLSRAALLAFATLQLGQKHRTPDARMDIPGFTVGDFYSVFPTGMPELFAFTSRQIESPHADMLVFRGSEEGMLASDGVSLEPVPCRLPGRDIDFGRVARGVMELYCSNFGFEVSLRDLVLNAAHRFGRTRPLLVGGHGLGGAVSRLALLDILASRISPPARIEHYTFGSPPTGDAAFVDAFNSIVDPYGPSYRVENRADAECAIGSTPPGELRHVGTAWTFEINRNSPPANHSLIQSYAAALEFGEGALTLEAGEDA